MKLANWVSTGFFFVLLFQLVQPITTGATSHQARQSLAPNESWAGSQIVSGNGHTCALTAAGGVVCWGHNYYGVLGDGTNQRRLVPTPVVGLSSGVAALTAGIYHTCALTISGGVKCWGSNSSGQLGNSMLVDSNVPVDVFSLTSGITAISAGGSHTCAVTTTGVKCWGQNLYGQLGNGSTTRSTIPVPVVGLESGVATISSGFYHTCAVTTAGGVKCWGSNGYGQIGDGTINTQRLTPVDVSNLTSGAVQVSAGGYHSCAVLTNGDLKCWGANSYGQLGDGSNTYTRLEPVNIISLSGQAQSVEAGRSHTCAVSLTGAAMCWGYNFYGQVGDDSRTNRNLPTPVIGLGAGVTTITAGDWHSCALTTTGEALCWGGNSYGQLGDGTTVQRLIPVYVAHPGTISSYTISGRVTDEAQAPVAGVQITANGDPELKTFTNTIGYYTFTNLLPGTYILIPYLAGSQFEPLSRTVSISPAANGVDFTALPAGDHGSPIVFVHGFMGFPPALPWQCTPEHQTQLTQQEDADKYFSIVDDLFKAGGYHVFYAQLISNRCFTASIETNAGILNNTIQHAKTDTNTDTVTLIAHSMGGLVSRAYLERSGEHSDVAHLYTFGTPHHGILVDVYALLLAATASHVLPGSSRIINLGNYCDLYGPAVCEFSVSQMLLTNLFYPRRNDNTKYHLVSGEYSGPRNLLGNVTNFFIPDRDDGIVGIGSGTGTFLSGSLDQLPTNEQHNVFGPTDPTSSVDDPRYYNNYFYLREDGLLSDSYNSCIQKIPMNPEATCSGSAAMTSSQQFLPQGELSVQVQYTPLDYQLLQVGQIITRSIELEGGPTVFAALWPTGTLQMSLVDPIGTAIDPIFAASNPGTITYTLETNAAAYSLNDALPGAWQIILNGSGLPPAGSPVLTLAAFESPLNLLQGVDRPWYTPGQGAVVTATLTGEPVSSAILSATVSLSDGVSQTITLIPNGSGIYSGTYIIPAVPGYASLQILARGLRSDGLPFERGASQLFQISPQSIVLNGIYSELPQPIQPGASLYSALDIEVGVTAQVSGTYSLVGDLVEASGQLITHVDVTQELSVGSQSLTLRFDAAEIFASMANGPYVLTHLFLIDERNGALVVAEADDVYTTAAYRYCQFGNCQKYTWYLAEGYTDKGYSTYILIQNPGDAPADVSVTYMLQGGGVEVRNHVAPAHSRYTIQVHKSDQLGTGKAFSTKLEADQQIIVERAMYWPNGLSGIGGGHAGSGIRELANIWYLAEGYTGGNFQTYILIQNPNDQEAQVTLTYMLSTGVEVQRMLTILPNARYTVSVHNSDQLGLGKTFSTKVDASIPVIVERAMYFGFDGHVSAGLTSLNQTWYLAEGYTDKGFTTYILIQNPGDAPANVKVTYMLQGGGVEVRNHVAPAHSRYTIHVHNPDQLGTGKAFSTKLESDHEIIVERAVYWSISGNPMGGGHAEAGITQLANTWYLAEGFTGNNFQTYILIQNPNDQQAQVTLTYMLSTGEVVLRTLTIVPNARYTVSVHNPDQLGPGKTFSTKIDASLPVIVERAMYFPNGGHDVAGIILGP